MSKKQDIVVHHNEPMPQLEKIIIPPSQAFQKALIQELRLMENGKREAHRDPIHTCRIELEEHINRTLNALYKENKIKVGDTIGDKYILTLIEGTE